MKKMFVILCLLTFIFPCVVFANAFTNIRFAVVFDGKTGSSNVDKIYVRYTTYTDGIASVGEITLNKSDNFQSLIMTTPIEDIKLNYALAITADGDKDIYGVVRYENTVRKDELNNYIELSMVAKFDSRGFDGKKYRANSDISNDDIENVKNVTIDSNSSKRNISTVTTTTINNSGNNNSNIVTKETTTLSIHEQELKEREEKKEQQTQKSINILLYIVIGIAVILLLAFLITIVNMKRANNRV